MKRVLWVLSLICSVVLIQGVLPASAYIPVSNGGIPLCPVPSTKEIGVYFGNGVATTPGEAMINAGHLISLMNNHVAAPLGTCVNFKLAYNPTSLNIVIPPLDFLEAAIQLYQISPTEFWRAYWNLASTVDIDALTALATASLVPVLANAIVDTGAIQAQADLYKSDIQNSCRSVLVVAHSQGNLYAIQAFNRLFTQPNPPPQEAFKIIGVAVPASFLPPASSPSQSIYVTSSTDKLIDAVRTILPNTLAAITNWGPTGVATYDPLLGHAFEGYTKASPSKDLLASQIQGALQTISKASCFRFTTDTYAASSPTARTAITVERIGSDFKTTESVGLSVTDGSAHLGSDYSFDPNILVGLSFKGASSDSAGERLKNFDIQALNNPSRVSPATVNLELTPFSQFSLGLVLSPSKATLKIPPGTGLTCDDPNPNISAIATIGGYHGGDSKGLDSPAGSVSVSNDLASATAGGQKGNASVTFSASMVNREGSGGRASVSYGDSFKITSPSKALGSKGTAILTAIGGASASGTCQSDSMSGSDPVSTSAGATISDRLTFSIGYEARFNCPDTIPAPPTPTSVTLSFDYGQIVGFSVTAVAAGQFQGPPWGPSLSGSTTGSADISYNVSVQNDPDAVVTWCRTPPQ